MIEKIGIQTFTIRNNIKTLACLEESFRYYCNIGIKNFELARIHFDEQEMNLLKRLKDELGLEYTACQLTLSKIVKNFDFMINFCRQLDIKYLEVSVIPIQNFIKGKKGILDLCLMLDNLGRKTAEHGVHLLYHHHNFELINFDGITSFDLMIKGTDEKLVSFVCDTYWLAKSGYDPAKFIVKRLSRVKGIHLKDIKLQFKLGKFVTTDTAIGEGTIDFNSVIMLDNNNQIDFYSIEQDTKNPKEDIKRSYTYLKEKI